MSNIKVTAIILNYNSSLDCKKCVDYLKKQDYSNLSIIIVDNKSSDVSEEKKLIQICNNNNIKLIMNSANSGFSAGNNVGIKAAINDGAEWILVINPDVELRDPHYISYVVDQIPKWSSAVVIGTNTLLPSGQKQNPMREITFFEEIFWPIEWFKQKIGVWDGYRSKDETGYCEKVSGCCFFISKKFLIENSFLDESVFMYCEEPILCKSVIKLGYRELYIKEVTAYHEHYEKQKIGNNSSKMQLFLKSRIYYIEKYSDYPNTLKKIAKFSRKIQLKVWTKK